MRTHTQRTYAAAAKATGKTERELRRMAADVFASMLHHAMREPPETVWSICSIREGRLDIEVNVPPRPRQVTERFISEGS